MRSSSPRLCLEIERKKDLQCRHRHGITSGAHRSPTAPRTDATVWVRLHRCSATDRCCHSQGASPADDDPPPSIGADMRGSDQSLVMVPVPSTTEVLPSSVGSSLSPSPAVLS